MDDMSLHTDNTHELSRDAMLNKIVLLTVAYFCVGTELRFMSQQGDNMSTEYKRRSEMWHAQALEASARYLPSDCPLVAHVITNY